MNETPTPPNQAALISAVVSALGALIVAIVALANSCNQPAPVAPQTPDITVNVPASPAPTRTPIEIPVP